MTQKMNTCTGGGQAQDARNTPSARCVPSCSRTKPDMTRKGSHGQQGGLAVEVGGRGQTTVGELFSAAVKALMLTSTNLLSWSKVVIDSVSPEAHWHNYIPPKIKHNQRPLTR